MAYRITADCMACGDCAVACPVRAIENGYMSYNLEGAYSNTAYQERATLPGKQEFADTFYITERCIDCGECAEVCPTRAIVFEEN